MRVMYSYFVNIYYHLVKPLSPFLVLIVLLYLVGREVLLRSGSAEQKEPRLKGQGS